MLVEEFSIENIKCFEKADLSFKVKGEIYKWITFLGENGGGKSTALQSISLLLAGPEAAQQLLPRPEGWVRSTDNKPGKISMQLHKGRHDGGTYGEAKKREVFGYTFYITDKNKIVRNKTYNEPSIVENPDSRGRLTWLRRNAFSSQGQGWFATGFGAFRRLTRSHQIIVPTLQSPARHTNFLTQFNENEPLSALEQWLVHLDYRIAKSKDTSATHQKEIGISAINNVLPEGVCFDSVTAEGRILFDVKGQKVPTITLSDGYRSVLALSGDLIWRLLEAFPGSKDPLKEEGVVLIDELDIHLHPAWQRTIARELRRLFPNIQFIVATHSPLIAAGAGDDALTLRFDIKDGKATIERIENISRKSVDDILLSDAFQLVSSYSPETQEALEEYQKLRKKKLTGRATAEDERQMKLFIPMLPEGIADPPKTSSIMTGIEEHLKKKGSLS